MKVLGIRFCQVASRTDAAALAETFRALGLSEREIGLDNSAAFQGAVFPVDENPSSWVEIWAAGEGFPQGTMLQLIVDDADAFAAQAKASGLSPQGPTQAHGEKVYYLQGPMSMPISFQSAL